MVWYLFARRATVRTCRHPMHHSGWRGEAAGDYPAETVPRTSSICLERQERYTNGEMYRGRGQTRRSWVV